MCSLFIYYIYELTSYFIHAGFIAYSNGVKKRLASLNCEGIFNLR